MKRNLLIIIAVFALAFSAIAQQDGSSNQIDSLLKVLSTAKQDSNRVNTLVAISRQYLYINTDEGIRYGRQALQLADTLKFPSQIAAANSILGSNYVNAAEYAKGLEHEYVALGIYEQLGDSAKQAVLLQNIGVAHQRARNSEEALKYEKRALAMFFALRDSNGVAALYNNIANVYRRKGMTDSVLFYNLKSLEMFQLINDPYGTARMIGNIANYYADEGMFGSAMFYYFDAIRRERALEHAEGMTRNLGNLGETYLEIANDTTGKIASDSLIPKGKAANLKLAIEYLEQAVALSDQQQLIDYYLEYTEALSNAYYAAGRTKEAFDLYQKFVAKKDSVYDVDKLSELNNARLKFEYGHREDSLKFQQDLTSLQLRQEQESRSRDMLFYIIGTAFGLIFTGFLYNRYKVTQNQKKIIEIERNRSEELLLNILPEETAQELKEKGKSDARLMEQVTVLFTDFKGFTQYAERLSPQELVAEINECFCAFDRIMEKYGVEKIKTIGDAYMAAGGLPTSNDTHAEDVVNAAIEIRTFMRNWASLKNAAGREFFETRIGIHTGPVVAGIVGIKKFQYDIWGDTVNIASRMESTAEPGTINISQTTYELVKNKFKCTPRGRIEAKNKGGLEMYFVD